MFQWVAGEEYHWEWVYVQSGLWCILLGVSLACKKKDDEEPSFSRPI